LAQRKSGILRHVTS